MEPLEITFLFGILCLILLTPYVYFGGDFERFLHIFWGKRAIEFLTKYCTTCVTCFAHTYLTILTVTIAGSDGINIAGILKDVALTYVSLIFFKDVEVTSELIGGLTLSFGAALFYIFLKFKSTFSASKKLKAS